MKTLLLLTVVMLFGPLYAAKLEGPPLLMGHGKEGGQPVEMKFHEIRKDIQSWIVNSGSADLKLPNSLTVETYNSLMTQLLADNAVIVNFTSNKHLVSVNGVEKTCINYRTQMPTITCLESKFASLSVHEQYKLVHHEFAALAGIERGINGVSNYAVSVQITAYLEDTVVKKLAIKNINSNNDNPDLLDSIIQSLMLNPMKCQTIRPPATEYKDMVNNKIEDVISNIVGYSPYGKYNLSVTNTTNGDVITFSKVVNSGNGYKFDLVLTTNPEKTKILSVSGGSKYLTNMKENIGTITEPVYVDTVFYDPAELITCKPI